MKLAVAILIIALMSFTVMPVFAGSEADREAAGTILKYGTTNPCPRIDYPSQDLNMAWVLRSFRFSTMENLIVRVRVMRNWSFASYTSEELRSRIESEIGSVVMSNNPKGRNIHLYMGPVQLNYLIYDVLLTLTTGQASSSSGSNSQGSWSDRNNSDSYFSQNTGTSGTVGMRLSISASLVRYLGKDQNGKEILEPIAIAPAFTRSERELIQMRSSQISSRSTEHLSRRYGAETSTRTDSNGSYYQSDGINEQDYMLGNLSRAIATDSVAIIYKLTADSLQGEACYPGDPVSSAPQTGKVQSFNVSVSVPSAPAVYVPAPATGTSSETDMMLDTTLTQ